MLLNTSAGGKGDLSILGVKAGDSVIYVAPGGAVAAVAFLAIASQVDTPTATHRVKYLLLHPAPPHHRLTFHRRLALHHSVRPRRLT